MDDRIEYKRRVSRDEVEKNKKVRVSCQEDFDEDQALSQAILFADTLDRKFLPITLERPKVLLPLLNIPMIEYTLTLLSSHGVKQVFAVCADDDCFEQVGSYLKNSTWWSDQNFRVTMIQYRRFADLLDMIHGDFVIVRGDIVSDMCIQEAHKAHKERRKKDRDAIMTMVINRPERDIYGCDNLCGYDELHTTFDYIEKQLLYYEYDDGHEKTICSLGKLLPLPHPASSSTCRYQDCHIYVCSRVVLTLIVQFDELPRMDRVVQMVLQKMPNYKIFTHEHSSGYADRVDKLRSYDTISQGLIERLTSTSESGVQSCECGLTELDRQGIYRDLVLGQSRFVEHFSVVGKKTTTGPSSMICNSVIGNGCTIGSNVTIIDSYIWDDVNIKDGCRLTNAIICDGVVIKPGSSLGPGMILSFKVEVGPQFRFEPGNLKVSLVPPREQDELVSGNACRCRKLDLLNGNLLKNSSDTSEVGASAARFGFIWCCEGYEEDSRNSISPPPMTYSPFLQGCSCL